MTRGQGAGSAPSGAGPTTQHAVDVERFYSELALALASRGFLTLNLPAKCVRLSPMPEFRLFGDEHVRQYEPTGGKVGHDWNDTSVLILHALDHFFLA